MKGFKVGDIITNPGTPQYNWLKIQLFEDRILVIDARSKEEIGTHFKAFSISDYNEEMWDDGCGNQQQNEWFLCDEHSVDNILKKYGAN